MTLDGTYLQRPDVELQRCDALPVRDVRMAYAYTGVPAGTPVRFKASARSTPTPCAQARSCIVAGTESGNKMLSSPMGSTASVSVAEYAGPSDAVAGYPLRIMPNDGWLSDGDRSPFMLDTGETPNGSLQRHPHGQDVGCGGQHGELVSFLPLTR